MNTLIVKNSGDEHIVLATRGGAYAGTISEKGLHLVAPWKKVAMRLTKEDVRAHGAACAKTRDGKDIVISTGFNFTITDPAAYFAAGAKPFDVVEQDIAAAVREQAARYGLADIWNERARLATDTAFTTGKPLARKYGVALGDIEVREINLSSHCFSAPGEKLKAILDDARTAPGRLADEMGGGLGQAMRVGRALSLKKKN